MAVRTTRIVLSAQSNKIVFFYQQIPLDFFLDLNISLVYAADSFIP